MYCVFSSKNMATKADRCALNDVRVNGSVSFSVLEETIFVFVNQD